MVFLLLQVKFLKYFNDVRSACFFVVFDFAANPENIAGLFYSLNIVCLDQRVSLASTHSIILDVFNRHIVLLKKKKINTKKKGDKRDLKIN